MTGERGSASIWVLAGVALVFAIGMIGVVRTEAVLARHRAESAADLAALAAAGQIGVGDAPCAAAKRIAAANDARATSCTLRLDADGRSGTVIVHVSVTVHLPVVGARRASATARAGRLASTAASGFDAVYTRRGYAYISLRRDREVPG